MSDVKLPEWLTEQMQGAMSVGPNPLDFRDGFLSCYYALLERAPEFDETTARLYADGHYHWSDFCGTNEDAFVEGARWQHAQDAARIAARDAEIERLNTELKIQDDVNDILTPHVAELKAEVERLRDKIKQVLDLPELPESDQYDNPMFTGLGFNTALKILKTVLREALEGK